MQLLDCTTNRMIIVHSVLFFMHHCNDFDAVLMEPHSKLYMYTKYLPTDSISLKL